MPRNAWIGIGCAVGVSAAALVLGLPEAGGGTGRQSRAAAVCDRAADPSGRDSGPGTVRRPFRTAQRLVDRLAPGQVGCLLGGRFEEDVHLERGGARGRPITLRSAPGRRATLTGTLDITRSANDVAIIGLRLIGGEQASPQVNGDRVTFRWNDISNDHRAICLLLGPGFESGPGRAVNVVIDRNRIHDCGRLPATGHDHGVYVEGTNGVRITRNVIYNNADYGVHLYPDAQGTYVARNIIDGNGGGVIFAGEEAGGEYDQDHASSNNVVTRNVISNSRRYHNIESYWGGPVGTGNVATRNCLWNGADGNISEQEGFRASLNVIARPRYRDRPRQDFRLAARTVCARLRGGS